MSEPKRYSDLDVWKALHFGDNDSGWVKWEDYARLKAEVERLEKEKALSKPRLLIASQDIKLLKDEVQHFKAEVERLTYVDDFIVIQRSSVVSIQEVYGPEDGCDSECKWRYFIRVNKAEYDKVLKHMEEFWSSKEGKQS